MRRVYVLYDSVSATWIGQLVVDRADAPVIRMFHDLLRDPKTGPGMHPNDYEIRHVGFVGDDGQLIPSETKVIATGAAWAASQTPSQG